jgi:predicted esterase
MKAPPAGKIIPVYVSDGIQDANGFYPGAEELAKRAAALGYEAAFDSLEGGHMMLNFDRIASFLKDE